MFAKLWGEWGTVLQTVGPALTMCSCFQVQFHKIVLFFIVNIALMD